MKKIWDVTVTIVDIPPKGEKFLTKKEVEQEVRDYFTPATDGVTVKRKVEAQDRELYRDLTFTGIKKKKEGKGNAR